MSKTIDRSKSKAITSAKDFWRAHRKETKLLHKQNPKALSKYFKDLNNFGPPKDKRRANLRASQAKNK